MPLTHALRIIAFYSIGLHIFYDYGDQNIFASSGMAYEAQPFLGRHVFMWLLSRSLDCFCFGGNLPTEAISGMVVTGLFPYSHSDYLAGSFSMDIDVFHDEKSWYVGIALNQDDFIWGMN